MADIADGAPPAQDAARRALRRDVTDHVACTARLPLRWLEESDHARREIATLVVERLEAGGHALVQQWRRRVLRGRDHAAFATMLRTVVWYVSLEYADRAEHSGAIESLVRRTVVLRE